MDWGEEREGLVKRSLERPSRVHNPVSVEPTTLSLHATDCQGSEWFLVALHDKAVSLRTCSVGYSGISLMASI